MNWILIAIMNLPGQPINMQIMGEYETANMCKNAVRIIAQATSNHAGIEYINFPRLSGPGGYFTKDMSLQCERKGRKP